MDSLPALFQTTTTSVTAVPAATMDSSNRIVLLVGVAGLLINAAVMFLRWLQIRADHSRRRQQLTLEVWIDFSKDHDPTRHALTDKFGPSLSESEAMWLRHPPKSDATEASDLNFRVRALLNALERIAIATDRGILDRGVLFDFGGGAIARTGDRYQNYIDLARAEYSPQAFAWLEQLAASFQTLIAERKPDSGHSIPVRTGKRLRG